MGLRRPPPPRRLHRRAARRRGRPPAAHRARPRGRLGRARARRRAPRADRPARRRPPRRRRARDRRRQGARRAGSPTGSPRIAGERPEIVTSDAPDASARIARFAAGSGTWLVSVLMVSEGVDIPRLRVGVYATSARTELFFRQVVGRFIRRTPGAARARCRTCSCPATRAEAARRRRSRRSATTRSSPSRRARRSSAASAASRARRSARCGRAPAATTTCCRRPRPATRCSCSPRPRPRPRRRWPRSAAASPPPRPRPPAAPSRPAGETAYERRERLREERRALVAAISRRTGEEHRVINARVNRDVGAPSVAKATVEQLERANALLEREAAALASRAHRTRCPSGPTARSRRSPPAGERAARDPGLARPARRPARAPDRPRAAAASRSPGCARTRAAR